MFPDWLELSANIPLGMIRINTYICDLRLAVNSLCEHDDLSWVTFRE